MNDGIEADIMARIRGITLSKKPIDSTKEIYHDLHIAGDDAAELLDGIAKTDKTSFDGFVFRDYFVAESEAIWFYLKARLGFPDRTKKSLTIGHLVAVVAHGSWFDAAPG